MLTANYDSLTLEQLTGVVGKKWTTFPDCIGAFIAEMDFGTAPAVIEALHETVENGFFGYLPDALEQGLAAACADWYKRATGWDVPVDNIHSMPDVLKGLEITLRHYAPRGGKLIVPTPAYMPFLMLPKFLGREYIEVPMIERNGRLEYDLDGIDAAFAAGGEVLIVCNPHNPVGRVLTRDELTAISEVVARHDGRVFSDEIHAPIIYGDAQHIPYASTSETAAGHTITAIAASKAWNLAGLKCAQIVLTNEADIAAWSDAAFWTAHGAATLGVIASIAAYNEGQDWLDDVLDYLDGNRRHLADVLAEVLPEVRYTMPEGTYLAWLDLSDLPIDGDLSELFREKARVAVVDGIHCGEVGKGSVRFNFAMPRPLIDQAVRQMATAIRSM
jgi:cysteine-S-conjugate beta-lyase